jgi:alpha-amylase
LDVLADFETRVLEALATCEKARLRYAWMRSVPAGQEFILYWGDGSPTGAAARSALELQRVVAELPARVAHYHLRRGDFASWFESVVGDFEFARRLREARTSSEDESKEVLLRLLEERRREIFGGAC